MRPPNSRLPSVRLPGRKDARGCADVRADILVVLERGTMIDTTRPLIDTLLPVRRTTLRLPLQLALGVVLMALLAQLRIVIGPIPITGQTLGVLLIGAAYGGRLGGLTLLAYLLVGGLGFGVFSERRVGLGVPERRRRLGIWSRSRS